LPDRKPRSEKGRTGRKVERSYKGRIIERYKVLPEQYEYLRSLVSDLNEQTYKFLAHVTASSLLKLVEEPDEQYSPVYSVLIRDKIGRNVDWRELRRRKLIKVLRYFEELGLSRRYKITEQLRDELLEIANNYSFEQHRKAVKVNLMTGKPIRARMKNVLSDESRNEEPKLYVDAVKEISRNGSYFNYRAVAAVINGRREKMEELREAQGLDGKDYKKAKRQWQNDYYCFLSVLYQGARPWTGEIWRYEPAYRPASTGRAQQIGGGFQSASKEMKAAAIEGLEDPYNYDLKDSQLYALRLLLEPAGCGTAWIDEYLSTPDNKRVYAARTGLTEDTWKNCLIALVMGAGIPKGAGGPVKGRREGSILKKLREESGGDPEEVARLLTSFKKIVQPLADELRAWHTWLINEYVPNNTKRSKRGDYIKNEAGKRLYLQELPKALWEKKAKVAAFRLQGIESAYIHNLTILGPQYGYRVIANEHDGVISLGLIPEEAMKKAAEKSGFTNAKLVIKPILKREETEEGAREGKEREKETGERKRETGQRRPEDRREPG
jgi:hypothetical protein